MQTDKHFGLIIGRFQPPCLHHLEFIKEVINSGVKELLISVGDSGTIDDKNFLTATQVKAFFPQIDESNTCLFTDNSYTSDCFTNYGHNFEHLTPTILRSRATNIRQMISENNSDWQKLVPKNVIQFIETKR